MIPINYVAVLLATAAGMVIGFLWYSQMLFAKQWMKEVGKTEKDIQSTDKAKMNKMLGLTFLAGLLFNYILAHFVYFTNAETLEEGIQLGVWAWLGFYMLPSFVNHLFEGKSMKLYAINGGYNLTLFILSGLILTSWK